MGPQDKLSSRFPSHYVIITCKSTPIVTRVLTSVLHTLAQNNAGFHLDIRNYPERRRGKISLSFDKVLGKCSDGLRKLLKSG